MYVGNYVRRTQHSDFAGAFSDFFRTAYRHYRQLQKYQLCLLNFLSFFSFPSPDHRMRHTHLLTKTNYSPWLSTPEVDTAATAEPCHHRQRLPASQTSCPRRNRRKEKCYCHPQLCFSRMALKKVRVWILCLAFREATLLDAVILWANDYRPSQRSTQEETKSKEFPSHSRWGGPCANELPIE